MKILFYILLVSSSLKAQCLLQGDIGDFEQNPLSSEWFTGTQGNGTIEQDNTEFYTGSSSVKVEVTTPSSWQVRMFNNNCTFGLVNGNFYRVTFYAKGTVGGDIDITLLDGGTTLSTQNIQLSNTSWSKYQVTFVSSVSSSAGKIKLAFKDVGTYFVDNLFYEEGQMLTINNTNPNICWEGVYESEILPNNEVRVFRMAKDYATSSLSGYYSANRASSSAGIILKLKTSSPTLNVAFAEDLTWASDVFNHKIAIYKDDVYQYSTNEFAVSLSNSTNLAVEWKFVMPSYTQMNLKEVSIESGQSLEPVNCNNKPVYIAIGNSITMGVGIADNESRDAYSRIIADSLGYELYNWGIGGSKIHDTIYSNLRNSSLNPELITVLWGYNDVHYSGNEGHMTTSTYPKYELLLSEILQNYPSTCVMAILPTFTTNPTNTMKRNIDSLEAEQLKIIQALQVSYPNLDYMRGMDYTDASGLNDDVHLNNSGNIALAEGVLSELDCGVITTTTSLNSPQELQIFPNPTNGILYLSSSSGEYSVYSVSGLLLRSGKVNNSQVEVADLPTGTYILQVIENNSAQNSLFIKR